MIINNDEYNNLLNLTKSNDEDELMDTFSKVMVHYDIFRMSFDKENFEYKEDGDKIFTLLRELYTNNVFIDDGFGENDIDGLVGNLTNILNSFDNKNETKKYLVKIDNYFNGEFDDVKLGDEEINTIKDTLILKDVIKRCGDQRFPLEEDDIAFYNDTIEWIQERLSEYDDKVINDVIQKIDNDEPLEYSKIAKELVDNGEENKELVQYLQIEEFLFVLVRCRLNLENKDVYDA